MKEIERQLKLASGAIDLIKMSQRTQHTSIKEALRKMLRCVSMLAEMTEMEVPTPVEFNEDIPSTIEPESIVRIPNEDLLKQAEKIAAAGKIKSETEEKEVE